MGTRSATSRDGTRIGWRETGSGEPILLIHGTGADHTRWEAFASWLADRFRLCLVDRRGRGLSRDGDAYSVNHEYDDVAAIAEAVGNVTVLGHSYGGAVALGAAARTEAIARAICYEGWPKAPGTHVSFDPGDSPAHIQALLDDGDEDGAVAFFMREVVGLRDDQVSWMRQQPAWAGRVAGARTLPRELREGQSMILSEAELRSITCPVLFVIGGQNEERLRPGAEALCSVLKEGRIAVLPGQGHTAMDTAPEMFADAIVSFIESPS